MLLHAGSIPPGISKLVALETFDAPRNQLSGELRKRLFDSLHDFRSDWNIFANQVGLSIGHAVLL